MPRTAVVDENSETHDVSAIGHRNIRGSGAVIFENVSLIVYFVPPRTCHGALRGQHAVYSNKRSGPIAPNAGRTRESASTHDLLYLLTDTNLVEVRVLSAVG